MKHHEALTDAVEKLLRVSELNEDDNSEACRKAIRQVRRALDILNGKANPRLPKIRQTDGPLKCPKCGSESIGHYSFAQERRDVEVKDGKLIVSSLSEPMDGGENVADIDCMDCDHCFTVSDSQVEFD